MNFPLDIIIEIFLRLPAISLLRFKSVCKLWYDLINGPDFVELHLQRSLATQTNLHFIVKTPVLYLVDGDTFDNPIELNYPYKVRHNGGVHVVGSCNGLLAFHSYEFDKNPIVIYNPTTQSYKKLPLLAISAPFSYLKSSIHFGFGYDSISQDYKCVRILMDFDERRMVCVRSDVMVYSLKDDLWRKASTPSVPSDFIMYGNSVFVNDTIHWVCEERVSEAYWKPGPIVAFNLRDETFSTLPIPNIGLSDMVVGVLDGCLCLSIGFLEYDSDVWLMKELGVAGSWTKLFSIANHNDYGRLERPICYSMNVKEFFVHFDVYLHVASIDLDTMEIRYVKVSNCYECRDACVCVENLLMLENKNDLVVEEEQFLNLENRNDLVVEEEQHLK